MGVYGADIAQLRGSATELDRAAGTLESISTLLGGELTRAPWHGADAVAFRASWDTDYSRRIVDAATRLRDAARSLRSNAGDQEQTSASGTGSLGGAAPGGGSHTGGGSNTGGGSGAGDGSGSQGDDSAGGAQGGGVDGRDPGTTEEIGLGASGEVTPGQASGRAALSAQFEGNWDAAGGTVSREGDYGLGVKGEAGWEFGFGDEEDVVDPRDVTSHRGDDIDQGQPGLSIGGQASGQAGAWAEDSISYSSGIAEVGASYDAMAGAQAEVGGGLTAGPDGLQAGVTAGAFAGAEIKGAVQADIGGVGGEIEAGLRAGIGADLSATAEIGLDRVDFEFEVGVAVGVGFTIKPSISFSPSEIAGNIADFFAR
ncbi:hypothetical protein [Microbacterium terregens]|uniref:WXG100 family type VII secretion target n=1 Tax=Microbacterium terregens TaxID=69363 RepID=A0ABV5SY90_9MICO